MTKSPYAITLFLIILLNVSFSYGKIPEIVLNQKKAVVTIYINPHSALMRERNWEFSDSRKRKKTGG